MGEATPDFDDRISEIDGLEDETVITVDGLNYAISDVIDAATDDLYFDYVVGDVSDFRDVNGNVHFDLDHGSASIHCVLLEFRREWVNDDLEDGMQVAVSGDLSYYEARGSCSVMVEDVIEIGDGAYRRVYEENRKILAEDGLLDEEHKRPIPEYPRTVGLVTSIDSDAREDAVTSIRKRHPDVDVLIQHSSVQGDDSMASMMSAISELDRDPEVDVIVLTRGGGADKTLRVFNETPLCRVVFKTDTPIVVGIGHERDHTLAEAVADERVMTPTDAGHVVPRKADLVETHGEHSEALEIAYGQTAGTRLRETATELDTSYESCVRDALSDAEAEIDRAFETLASERLTELDTRLDHAVEKVEQQTEHETETEQVKSEYERTQRRQRIAIVVLVLLVLALVAFLVL